MGHIIAGILLFAAATAVLYAWGLGKSMDQKADLARDLLRVCGNRVVKYLKKHDTITVKETARLIDGVTVGQFWSRKKLKVEDPEKFSKQVLAFLHDQQYIENAGGASYRLKKR